MAVAFVNSAEGGAGGNDLTLSGYVVAAGSDRLLVVGVILEADRLVNGVTFGGVSLTFLTAVEEGSGSSDARVELWYLVAPAASTADIVIDQSGAASASIVGIASNWTGVHQTTPFGGSEVTSFGTDSPATVDVLSTGAGDIVIDIVGVFNFTTPFTVGAGQTVIQELDVGGTSVVGAMSREPGGGTITMSWTLSPTTADWAQAAAAIKEATVPTVITPSALAVPLSLVVPNLNWAMPLSALALPLVLAVPALALSKSFPDPLVVPLVLSNPSVIALVTPSPLELPVSFPQPTILTKVNPTPLSAPIGFSIPAAFISYQVGIRHRGKITDLSGSTLENVTV